eukprot:4154699-Pyramimonas_sp.AAC.1
MATGVIEKGSLRTSWKQGILFTCNNDLFDQRSANGNIEMESHRRGVISSASMPSRVSLHLMHRLLPHR